ncbi:hypothetical protein AMJ57_03450 [Parcubacteria bacterium SG8_24]|nr:MAG: hypothetical protein AMJ57_03450 [Parcubacteria bacterium SG8_24]
MDWAIITDAVAAVLFAAIPLHLVWLLFRRERRPVGPGLVLLTALGLVLWTISLYAWFVEPRLLKVRIQPVILGQEGHGLRLAVVSDLHLGGFRDAVWLDRVVDRLNSLEADAVIILGDVVERESGMRMLEPLRRLESGQGAYAVLGRSDYETGAVTVRRSIESYGVEVLTNEPVFLSADDRQLRLIGIDDIYHGDPDWIAAFADGPPADITVLAAHNPGAAPVGEIRDVDLAVCGYTHGGQLHLPFLGPFHVPASAIGPGFYRGLYEFGPMSLFITTGAGEDRLRGRLLVPPEVVLLDISW